MNRTLSIALIALLLNFCGASGAAEETAATGAGPQYLRVSIDRVVIDTQGLAQASTTLAASVDELALALGRLSQGSASLTDDDRAQLAGAVQSVDAAAVALRRLAEEIPRTAHELNERLPQMISDASQPIEKLSSGLQAASDSVLLITESLPQATANARSLVDAALDAALLRLSIYTFVLFAALALGVVAVVWFIYRQYLAPLARKLDEISGAPEQFAAIARHMQKTSENLLQLERLAGQGPPPAPGA